MCDLMNESPKAFMGAECSSRHDKATELIYGSIYEYQLLRNHTGNDILR